MHFRESLHENRRGTKRNHITIGYKSPNIERNSNKNVHGWAKINNLNPKEYYKPEPWILGTTEYLSWNWDDDKSNKRSCWKRDWNTEKRRKEPGRVQYTFSLAELEAECDDLNGKKVGESKKEFERRKIRERGDIALTAKMKETDINKSESGQSSTAKGKAKGRKPSPNSDDPESGLHKKQKVQSKRSVTSSESSRTTTSSSGSVGSPKPPTGRRAQASQPAPRESSLEGAAARPQPRGDPTINPASRPMKFDKDGKLVSDQIGTMTKF